MNKPFIGLLPLIIVTGSVIAQSLDYETYKVIVQPIFRGRWANLLSRPQLNRTK